MTWSAIEGNWRAFKGRIQEQWGRLTDDDLARIEGRRTALIGKIQERYHLTEEEAEQQLAAWQSGIRVGLREAP